mgnify:CR=1 FL=1
MKVFLIDNNKIIKYMLPLRVDDSYLISYNSSNIKDCLITFVGENDSWYLKSNGTVNIVENNQEVDKVLVEPYKKYTLKIVGKSNLIELYFLPVKETLFKLDFSKLDNFSIGASETCHICYNSSDLTSVQAMFKLVGDDWVISCVNDENFKVYINNNRVTLKKLKSGDIIFIGGLKIVWMGKFICVNNPRNSLKITGMELINDNDTPEEEILPVSEDEKYVELYDKDDYFVHYPAIRETVVDKEVAIDAPPSKDNESNLPFILTMGSTIVMMSSSFIMAYNVWNGFNNGREITSMIPQIVMCVAMLIGGLILPKISQVWRKKQRKKREKLRQESYGDYLHEKDREIQLLVKNDMQILNDNYLNSENCLLALNKKNKNFWWCQYDDPEFLSIRVGIGRLKPNVFVVAPEKKFSLDKDNLLEEVYKVKEKYEQIDGMPITVSLKENYITSLISNSTIKNIFVNSIITQLVVLTSSIDLKLVIMTNKENENRWEFAKYLPHIFSDDKSIRFFSTNEAEAKTVSTFLEEELKERKNSFKGQEGVKSINPIPYYLIITDDYKETKNISIIDDIVNKDAHVFGFSLLAISDNIKQVPITSTAFIETNERDGVVINKNTGLNTQTIFYMDKIEELDMKDIALKLANIPITTKDGPSVLPSSLPFLDMFGVSKVEQLNILNRWQSNNPVVSLDTTIGVHANGDKFKLDLHEKYHGPHGLIAGSTGSGKSEFIITYILSLCINYHPYEVQFVLIDYKGGGLAGAFENKETSVKIPHLVGTMTNLDVSTMNRSLVSIQSELNRRQRIFNEVRDSLGEGTIDIYKYQKLYREGVVKKPMAHLFIICDEFAELKQQRPEFMQQLISISRIGRSLGIHLILATQKPSGVVNDQIWANSKFKVCLKVQDRGDSMEMLKRPEAASIKEAGRFYLQVGYNDLFDIGQSGWSGAKYIPSDKIIQKTDESINFIDNVGYVTKSIKDLNGVKETKEDYGDQLTNIVKYIYNLGKREELITEKLWLDPIPDVIYINDIKEKYSYKQEPFVINPIIGEYDDPVNQLQNILTIDLTHNGNLVIFGSVGSGKERLLMTLIRSIVIDHTPDEVNIYIADYGSESLKIFGNIPHVGDVISVDSPNKMQDLCVMLNEEIERRKDLFGEYAGSYNDYLANSGQKMPLIIVVINNWDVFTENYAKISEGFHTLFRDGAKYGVVFVLSVISSNTLRSRSHQYFTNKICLQLANDMDYRSLINAPRGLTPAKIFGRGIVELNDTAYEFQTASFAPDKDITNSLRELSQILNDAYISRAKPIPTIPLRIGVEDFLDLVTDKNVLPIGYDIITKTISYYDFSSIGILPILATNIDEIKMSFVHAIVRLLSLQNYNIVEVIDFAKTFPKEIENVTIYNKKEEIENSFINLNNNIRKSNESDKDLYYIIVAPSFIKETITEDLYEAVSEVFQKIKDYPKAHIIFVDVSNAFKELQLEKWYEEGINEKYGIWLGENAGNQTIINISKMPPEEKRLNFAQMCVAVFKGKYKIIKHVLDIEEEEDEE